MKVLVTGHFGKLGSILVPELFRVGYEVRGVDLKTGGDFMLPEFKESFEVFKPDVIFHLASSDIASSHVMMRYARKYGIRLIVKGIAGFPWSAEDTIVLGLSNAYGPGIRSGVVHEMVQMEKLSRPGTENPPGITIYGDGKQTRDFIYVEDVVKAFLEAFQWEPGYYEVATGRLESIFGIFRLMTFTWGYTPKLNYADARPGVYEHPQTKCDLPWTPVPLEEGLEKAIRDG